MSFNPRRWFIGLALAGLVVTAVLALLPLGISLAAERWLHKQGLQASIENIDLNLFTAEASLENTSIRNAEGRGLELDAVHIGWRYRRLLDRRLHFRYLHIDGVQVDIARIGEDNTGLEIAGFALPTENKETQRPQSDWTYGLDRISIQGTTLTYSDADTEQSLTLSSSQVDDVANWPEGKPMRLNSLIQIGAGSVQVQGEIQPFAERVSGSLNLQARGLPVGQIRPFLPSGSVDELNGSLNSDLDVTIQQENGQYLLTLKGSSMVQKYRLSVPEPLLKLNGKHLAWQGETRIEGTTGSPPTVTANGRLTTSQLKLQHLPTASKATRVPKLTTSGDLTVQLSVAASGYTLALEGDSQISDFLVELASPALTVNGQQFSWQGKSQIQGKANDRPLVSVEGVVGASQIRLHDSQTDSEVLQLKQLQLTQSQVRLEEQTDVISLGNLTLGGLKTGLSRDEDGRWNVEQYLQTAESAAEDPAGEADSPSPRATHFRIQAVQLDDGSQVILDDRSVDPAMHLDLRDIEAHLSGLDLQQPDQDSQLSLKSAIGDYGQLQLDGTLRPLAQPVSARIKGRASGINTVGFSGYAKKFIGHRIRQGTLNTDIDINIQEGQLDSALDVVLNKLSIAALHDKPGEFELDTGLPLKRALDLIRDRDENIRIELPVTGALDNPDFGLQDVLRKALYKSVQKAVISYYTPFGAVLAAETLINLATAIRFDPIRFDPGSAELNDDSRKALLKLTDTLLEKPKAQVSLCATAVPQDRMAFAERDAEANTRFFGFLKPDPDPEAVSDEVMLALTQNRMRAAGDYLIRYGVEAERLVLCEGEILDDDKAKPEVRVEL